MRHIVYVLCIESNEYCWRRRRNRTRIHTYILWYISGGERNTQKEEENSFLPANATFSLSSSPLYCNVACIHDIQHSNCDSITSREWKTWQTIIIYWIVGHTAIFGINRAINTSCCCWGEGGVKWYFLQWWLWRSSFLNTALQFD